MNAEECELAYRKLLAILEDARLGWVVEQVEIGIIAGDIELPEKRTSYTIIEDFSAQKKLIYLLDTIKQLVINTADMEDETISFFKAGVAFYPDREDSDPSFIIRETSLDPRRQEAINALRESLEFLRARISKNGSK